MDRRIDRTDFAILNCLAQHDGPLWKKKVYDTLQEHGAPVTGRPPAVQTVGRHVDRLQEEGYLLSRIIHTDEVDRQFLIGFTLTAKGRAAVAEKRAEILKEEVVLAANALIDPDEGIGLEKRVLLELIREEFGIDRDAVEERLEEEMSRDDLIVLLAMYYFRNGLSVMLDDLDPERMNPLIDFVRRTPPPGGNATRKRDTAFWRNGFPENA